MARCQKQVGKLLTKYKYHGTPKYSIYVWGNIIILLSENCLECSGLSLSRTFKIEARIFVQGTETLVQGTETFEIENWRLKFEIERVHWS